MLTIQANMTSPDDNRYILNGVQRSVSTSSLPRAKYYGKRSISASRANVRYTDEKVTLNVGGQRFQTYRATVKNYPGTLLYNLSDNSKYFDEQKQEFFFDRSSMMFESVLNYYRTGELHFGANVCPGQIKKELEFWSIHETELDECCWLKFIGERTMRKKREDLKNLVIEARETQTAAIEELKNMPPHDGENVTAKGFKALEKSNIYPDVRLIFSAIGDCRREISIFLALLFIATLFFAILIRIIESSENIPSFPSAIWWALVTLTTVGSGNLQPQSFLGVFVGIMCVIFGVIVVAIPLPFIANLLTDLRKRLEENKQLRQRDKAMIMMPGNQVNVTNNVRGRLPERKKNA